MENGGHRLMPTLTVELPDTLDERLRKEAERCGQTVDDYMRQVIEERVAASERRESERQAQIERNQAAIAMLRSWRELPPDLEEAEGYPLQITPLQLREPVILEDSPAESRGTCVEESA